MIRVIGLTGGIGSGKSSVADAFAHKGAPVVDVDAIAHALSEPGAAGTAAVAARFGARALTVDGSLDRTWLREQAFSDPVFRRALEQALHPLIGAQARLEVSQWRDTPYGILMVPLLLESGAMEALVDRVLVVDCPEELQVARVVARSGREPAQVRAIMAVQLPRAERLARADDIVDNSGPPDAIVPQVEALDRSYRAWPFAQRERAAGRAIRAE